MRNAIHTATEFYREIYGDELPGSLVICSFAGDGRPCDITWHRVIETAAEASERLSDHRNAYFNVGLRPHENADPYRRGGSDDVMAIPGLWADLDYGKQQKRYPPSLDATLEIVDALPQRPPLLVDSGGGLHAYWPFKSCGFSIRLMSERQRKEH